ncbi:MAG: hypothetical protein COA54_15855, partial [Thiotrichaceae bacterium]
DLNAYGYTGRLAKITGANQLTGVGSQLSEFSILPGLHTQVIHLSQDGVDKEHLYVQVNATPKERHPDFSNQGIHEGIIEYRPDQFVPFKVPVFDEDTTLLAQSTYRAAKQDNPDLESPEPIYQWLYRPEFQFSVYDLELSEINRYFDEGGSSVTRNIIDDETPVISGADDLIDLVYSLLEDDEDMLTAFSFPEERELVFAIGEEEVVAIIGEDQSVSFENLEHLASLDPEDFLSIRLYANNDAANILWEYAFEFLAVSSPEEIDEKEYNDTIYISADDPRIDITAVLVGYAGRDASSKVPQTVIWQVEGEGEMQPAINFNDTDGVFDSELVMPPTAGSVAIPVARLIDTSGRFNKVEVVPGKPSEISIITSGQAFVQGFSSVLATVTVVDAHGNLVQDGTSVTFRSSGKGFVQSYNGFTASGVATAVVKGGYSSGQGENCRKSAAYTE